MTEARIGNWNTLWLAEAEAILELIQSKSLLLCFKLNWNCKPCEGDQGAAAQGTTPESSRWQAGPNPSAYFCYAAGMTNNCNANQFFFFILPRGLVHRFDRLHLSFLKHLVVEQKLRNICFWEERKTRVSGRESLREERRTNN